MLTVNDPEIGSTSSSSSSTEPDQAEVAEDEEHEREVLAKDAEVLEHASQTDPGVLLLTPEKGAPSYMEMLQNTLNHRVGMARYILWRQGVLQDDMVVDRYGDVVLDMFRARRQQEDGENSVDAEALGVHMGDDTGGGDGMPAGPGVDATGACAADHCPDLEDVRAHEGMVEQLAAVEVAGNGDGDLASAMVGACGAAPLAGDGAGDGDVSASGGSKARDGTGGRAVLDGSDTGLAGFSDAEVDVDARPSGPVENMQQGGTGDGVGCDHGDGEACDGAGGSTVAAGAGTAMAGLLTASCRRR